MTTGWCGEVEQRVGYHGDPVTQEDDFCANRSTGDCENCRNSKDGHEQGFGTRECVTCAHPRVSNFAPRTKNRR